MVPSHADISIWNRYDILSFSQTLFWKKKNSYVGKKSVFDLKNCHPVFYANQFDFRAWPYSESNPPFREHSEKIFLDDQLFAAQIAKCPSRFFRGLPVLGHNVANEIVETATKAEPKL